MYDEDDDEVLETGLAEKIGNLYIVKVFKEYGIMYGVILTFFSLCYIIVLLPYTIKCLFGFLCTLINFVSGGDEVLKNCYWEFLILSLIGILVIWIAIKITNYRLDKKYGKVNKMQ